MLKDELIKALKTAGAYDVKIADPGKGFEYCAKEKHPLAVWSKCKSVISIVCAKAAETNNIYIGNLAPQGEGRKLSPATLEVDALSNEYSMIRLANLFKDFVAMKCISFLHDAGYDWYYKPLMVQDKLCAYEAGVGVYGRSGIILHPELGNRMSLTTIYTDAVLEPDKKCTAFDPCANCYACVKSCPGQAYSENGVYHGQWDMKKCITARSTVEQQGYFCHNCFFVCPAGKIKDEDLFKQIYSKSLKGKKAVQK